MQNRAPTSAWYASVLHTVYAGASAAAVIYLLVGSKPHVPLAPIVHLEATANIDGRMRTLMLTSMWAVVAYILSRFMQRKLFVVLAKYLAVFASAYWISLAWGFGVTVSVTYLVVVTVVNWFAQRPSTGARASG